MTGPALLAAGWATLVLRAFALHTPQPLGATPFMGVGIGVLLMGVTSWLAFGQESWHVERNLLERRVGIGPLGAAWSYRDAQVAVTPYANRWGRQFIRLFVMDSKGRHFLIDRPPADALAFADFVCGETQWKRVDFPSVRSTGLDGFTT